MGSTDEKTSIIAAEAQACCAHMKVVYERINHEGGLCSDSWKCKDCGTKFVPEPFIKTAIEKATEPFLAILQEVYDEHMHFGWGYEELHDKIIETLGDKLKPQNAVIESYHLESRAAHASEQSDDTKRDGSEVRLAKATTEGEEHYYVPPSQKEKE